MKRVLSLVLLAAMLMSTMIGCGKDSSTSGTTSTAANSTASAQSVEATATQNKDVTIKVLQVKVEIADVLKKMEADYEKEFPGVKLRFETVGGGTNYDDALMAKFQSGDAPDVFVNGGHAALTKFIEKAEDLSDQPWVKDMVSIAAGPMTRDGKLYGQPQAIEGFGFAYNKALFAKAGITTLPNTLSTLEDACKKLQAAGIQPFSNSYAEWWALGMHNINVPLAHQEDAQKFLDDVAAGTTTFKASPVTEGWLKLLDLTVNYGQKNPTTSGDYATSVNNFAAGKAAMIQQGNWIQPDLDKIDANLDVGFIPMPISETPDEKISAGIPNYWVVHNGSQVKDDAKAWLNWLVTSETGKRYITDELKFIPAFTTIKSSSFKGLNAALAEFGAANKTYPWVFPKLPAGSPELCGQAMMKYLGKQLDSDKFLAELDKIIIDKTKAAKK